MIDEQKRLNEMQEHAEHICRVLGCDQETARMGGLAIYLADLSRDWERRGLREAADVKDLWSNPCADALEAEAKPPGAAT